MKKFITGFFIAAILFSLAPSLADTNLSNIKVLPNKFPIYVNGEEQDIEAYNIDGYTYIKLADIGKAFGNNTEILFNQSKNIIEIRSLTDINTSPLDQSSNPDAIIDIVMNQFNNTHAHRRVFEYQGFQYDAVWYNDTPYISWVYFTHNGFIVDKSIEYTIDKTNKTLLLRKGELDIIINLVDTSIVKSEYNRFWIAFPIIKDFLPKLEQESQNYNNSEVKTVQSSENNDLTNIFESYEKDGYLIVNYNNTEYISLSEIEKNFKKQFNERKCYFFYDENFSNILSTTAYKKIFGNSYHPDKNKFYGLIYKTNDHLGEYKGIPIYLINDEKYMKYDYFSNTILPLLKQTTIQ